MITADSLQSPADADNFRMTKDFGRWYFDPIPTDEIAPATEEQWPSYSYIKKAADKDWSFLTVNRLAALEPAELHRIADLDHTQRGDAIRSQEKLAKNTNFGRGTIIHLWCEDLAHGGQPRTITDQWLQNNRYPTAALQEAYAYQAALVDFFHTYQPEPVALEYVTIHRTLHGHGYGCTPDGLFHIDAQLAAVDWKTRGEASSHAAYPEEAAQIAAGAMAEYMVTRDGGQARRQLIPKIDVGYVVSIKPDGTRLYPVDLPKAWEHFQHLHQWWVHTQTAKQSIGRVKPYRTGATPILKKAEARMAVDTKHNTPVDNVTFPSEGGPINDKDFQPLKARFDKVTPEARKWFGTLVKQANQAGVSFNANSGPKTTRRWEIYRGLLAIADSMYYGPGVDEILGALVYEVTGNLNTATVGPGVALGLLDHAQATAFADLATRLANDNPTVIAIVNAHTPHPAA